MGEHQANFSHNAIHLCLEREGEGDWLLYLEVILCWRPCQLCIRWSVLSSKHAEP